VIQVVAQPGFLVLGEGTPVTGAAVDEYNLDVDQMLLTVTRMSLSHAGLPASELSQWGSGGYPQPPEVKR
jgi:hypothetical protein